MRRTRCFHLRHEGSIVPFLQEPVYPQLQPALRSQTGEVENKHSLVQITFKILKLLTPL